MNPDLKCMKWGQDRGTTLSTFVQHGRSSVIVLCCISSSEILSEWMDLRMQILIHHVIPSGKCVIGITAKHTVNAAKACLDTETHNGTLSGLNINETVCVHLDRENIHPTFLTYLISSNLYFILYKHVIWNYYCMRGKM